jgi:hypothetical protein
MQDVVTRSIFASFLAALVAACAPHKTDSRALKLTEVFIGPSTYRLGGTTFPSTSDLVAALRSEPTLEAVYIIPEPGVPNERVSNTISSIRAAGIAVPIGMVGNEVF